jgi:isopenicillin N synthase-like dioxygenase
VRLALTDAEAVTLDVLTQESRAFFELAPEAKDAYRPASLSDWTGYLAPRSSGLDDEGDDFERIAVTPGSPESLQVSALARDRPRLNDVVNQAFDLLVSKCRQLSHVLSTIIGIDPEESERIWFDQHSSKLAINHYPRATANALAAHRDFGGISLIYVGRDSSGLQLSGPVGDRWCPVGGANSSTVVALLGELYSYWTDGLWPAAPHRVVNPLPGRISIVLFHTPNRQTELPTVTGVNSTVLVESFLSGLEQRYLRIK